MKNDKPNINKKEEISNDQGHRAYSHNLKYNEEKDSFELDVEPKDIAFDSEERAYQHDDPYDSVAPQGEDDNSDWDEANPYVGDEYEKDRSLETDVDKLGMHIDSGKEIRLSKADEALAKTSEDSRDDLDEEGYPKKDN